MPTRTTAAAPGTPCWIDLQSKDVAKSKAFYTALMGWTVEESGAEFGNYVNFLMDGAPVAGMSPSQQPEIPDAWSVYLATEDASATAAKVKEAGGQVMVPPMEVGPFGWMAVCVDTSGAVFGVWQAKEHVGSVVYGEPGGPFWHELWAWDFAAASAFYPKVFPVVVEAMSEAHDFRYSLFKIGDEMLAGMMDPKGHLPEGVPSHWAVYLTVADVDATAAKVPELGGTVTRAPFDTPYGRMLSVTDPTGAHVMFAQPPA